MKGAKEEKEKNSPNVLALIERFNQVSNWVATTIIFEEDLETRRDVLVYFIHLANKCRELHNFNAMMEGQCPRLLFLLRTSSDPFLPL